jgi:hypothetical protein
MYIAQMTPIRYIILVLEYYYIKEETREIEIIILRETGGGAKCSIHYKYDDDDGVDGT